MNILLYYFDDLDLVIGMGLFKHGSVKESPFNLNYEMKMLR